jgi:ComF family protein
MGFDVKITTMHKFFELICPHYCINCGEIGEILCERCKNYNSSGGLRGRLKYGGVDSRAQKECDMAVFMVGYRDELVGKLISEYKFHCVRALAVPLAEMLSGVVPELPRGTVVVPLPTISRHIRQRGFDHMGLLARKLAKMRGWRVEKLLVRAENTVQVGAGERQRKEQAKRAYKIRGEVRKGANYLVIDDVWTTGASMGAACRLLREAGAENITIAVLAKNRNESF